nr:MAG TPA: hypothetical protein [Caudoviricetes sp.]
MKLCLQSSAPDPSSGAAGSLKQRFMITRTTLNKIQRGSAAKTSPV